MFLLRLSSQALFLLVAAFLLAGSRVNGMAIPEGGLDVEKRSKGPLKVDFTVPRDEFILTNTTTGLHFVNLKDEKRSVSVGKRAEYLKNKRAFLRPLHNEGTYYSIDIYLGSDEQHLQVDIDTGSSDLWVPSNNVDCSGCTDSGTFDPSDSSTFTNLNENYEIAYEDQSTSQGYWGTDNFGFTSGSPTISDLQFAVVTQTSVEQGGILGIAIEQQESTSLEYPNVPVALANQGVIDKPSYSVYLNNEDATTGTLLFGGIDEAKFSGDLVKLPYSPVVDQSAGFFVEIDSVKYPDGSSTSVNGYTIFDTGTTLTYFTQEIFQEIGEKFGGQLYVTPKEQYYVVDCSLADEDDVLTYEFPGVSIEVPYSDLVMQLYYSNGQPSGQCALLILPENLNILGDNFLRHAYLYYDIADQYIGVKQVKYTSDSHIVSA